MTDWFENEIIEQAKENLRDGIESEQCVCYATEGCVCCKRWIALIDEITKSLESAKQSPEPVEGQSPEPVEGQSPEPVEGQSPKPVEGAESSEYPIGKLIEWLRSDAVPLALQDGCNKAADRLDAQQKEIEAKVELAEPITGITPSEMPQHWKKAEPPAGEFTKEVRTVLGDPQRIPTRLKTVTDYLLEACDRLDAQQQEIERLKALLKDYRNQNIRYHNEKEALAERNKKVEKRLSEFSDNVLMILENDTTLDKDTKQRLEYEYNQTKHKTVAKCDRLDARQQEIEAPTAENKAQAKRIEKLENALRRIQTWAEAYPLDIFPKPDLKKAREVLEAANVTLDAISADAMRHVLEGVKSIVEQALAGCLILAHSKENNDGQ